MVPSAEDIARVPAENLHVSRAEFGAVWTAAEAKADERADSWYLAGVCRTCQWVAGVLVRPTAVPGHPARAPVTKTSRMAYAELVERESLASEMLLTRRPVPAWLQDRFDWVVGIDATFAWFWRRTGPPPITVERTASGPATT